MSPFRAPRRLTGAREALRELALRRRRRRAGAGGPILVYQMGKVGSSTVVDTLFSLRLADPVLHLHTLDPARLERAIGEARRHGQALPDHLLVSRVLGRDLARGTFPCRIVTLTRDPVERAISFAFQDLARKAPRASPTTPDPDVVKRVVSHMLRDVPGHADPSRWFDRELKGIFGVDVFRQPYDVDAGFTIVGGSITVLVIRMEDLDRALPVALGRFLDRDPAGIIPVRSNMGTAKGYAESLRFLKRSYRLPDDLIERVLGTRYVRHFYAREMSLLRNRWTDGGSATGAT